MEQIDMGCVCDMWECGRGAGGGKGGRGEGGRGGVRRGRGGVRNRHMCGADTSTVFILFRQGKTKQINCDRLFNTPAFHSSFVG